MSDIWYLDGRPVNNFPGAARVKSVGHAVVNHLEIGYRANALWDVRDADLLSYQLRNELEDAR